MRTQIELTIATSGKGSCITYHDSDESVNRAITNWLDWLDKCPYVNTKISVREII